MRNRAYAEADGRQWQSAPLVLRCIFVVKPPFERPRACLSVPLQRRLHNDVPVRWCYRSFAAMNCPHQCRLTRPAESAKALSASSAGIAGTDDIYQEYRVDPAIQHKPMVTRAATAILATFNHKWRKTMSFFITHQTTDQNNLPKKAILNHNQSNLVSLFVNRFWIAFGGKSLLLIARAVVCNAPRAFTSKS